MQSPPPRSSKRRDLFGLLAILGLLGGIVGGFWFVIYEVSGLNLPSPFNTMLLVIAMLVMLVLIFLFVLPLGLGIIAAVAGGDDEKMEPRVAADMPQAPTLPMARVLAGCALFLLALVILLVKGVLSSGALVMLLVGALLAIFLFIAVVIMRSN